MDPRGVVVAAPDAGRAEALATALQSLGLAPELTCSLQHEPHDERLVALVLDGLPTASTLRLMADTIARRPMFPIVVLGPVETDLEPLIALASGATGYLAADATVDEVATAVHSLLDGDVVLPAFVVATLVRGLRCSGRGVVLHRHGGAPVVLTHREWEVLVLLRQGRSTAEIAARFVVAPGTVRTHVSTIMRKLGADPRAALDTAD